MQMTAACNSIQLKNILLATDFSMAATAALPFAAELARHFGANLFAVHAKPPENYALPASELWPVAQARLDREIADFAKTLRDRFPSIKSEVLVSEGSVWQVVHTFADEKHADLIVVGTNGRRGIGKFVLGSVAEEIIRKATCPVLTVGPQSPVGVARGDKFRRILYATDFGDGWRAAAAYAVGLAQEQQAHLTLLHVIAHPRVGELVLPHEVEAAALENLQSLVAQGAELAYEPRAVVLHGAPAEKILEAADREPAELIVLGVKNARGIMRATHLATAVTHQVICNAMCPVLTVRV